MTDLGGLARDAISRALKRRGLALPDRPPRTFDEAEAAAELRGLEWEYIAAPGACEVGRALHGAPTAAAASGSADAPGMSRVPSWWNGATSSSEPPEAGEIIIVPDSPPVDLNG